MDCQICGREIKCVVCGDKVTAEHGELCNYHLGQAQERAEHEAKQVKRGEE